MDQLADLLTIEPDAVVGKLARLWIWADQHSRDGNANVTESGIDRRVSCPGFAAALRKVGWLEGRENALSLPHFERHNGQTAKARAESNRRISAFRDRKREKETGNADVTRNALQKPLPEKRREELIQTTHPARPSIDDLAKHERTLLPPHDIGFSEWWHDAMEASGWIMDNGIPVANWKAAYSKARSGHRHNAQEKAQRNAKYQNPHRPINDRNAGTANDPNDYADPPEP